MSEMKKIQVLSTQTADAIAAGEVVERPASVVKELVENALDASASKIEIEIRSGGIKKIRVVDNGYGIPADDAPLAFLRFSTSKIRSLDDLDTISSMGFRGEALASIAAVSKVQLTTRTAEAEAAISLQLEASELISAGYVGAPVGTSIEVSELFYNTPARFKFLKSDQSEASYVTDIVSKMALAHPEVSFRLLSDGKEVLQTPGNNDLRSVIYLLWGKEVAQGMHEVRAEKDGVKLHGLLARADLSRHNRSRQVFFVNHRYIHSDLLRQAVEEAGKTWFMKGRHAQCVLFLDMPASAVDVNVHPQKTEVRFAEERKIFSLLYHAIRDRLEGISLFPEASFKSTERSMQSSTAPSTERHENQNLQISPPRLEPNKAMQQRHFEETGERTVPNLAPSPALDWQRLVGEEQFTYMSHREARQGAEDGSKESPELNEDILLQSDPELQSLLNARLIGQLFATYILLEGESELILIDQHAAHERILYEQFRAARLARRQDPPKIETLLTPLQVDLSLSEIRAAEQYASELAAEGFGLSILGPETAVIREQPYTINERLNAVAVLREILAKLEKHQGNLSEVGDELDHTYACKAAIKAHDVLSYEEMKNLILQLSACQNAYHCPHGRPVVTKISRYEVEKLFKRVV